MTVEERSALLIRLDVVNDLLATVYDREQYSKVEALTILTTALHASEPRIKQLIRSTLRIDIVLQAARGLAQLMMALRRN